MKLLPSVVLKLFLAAVFSALVTGESLERLRRGWRMEPAIWSPLPNLRTSCCPREVAEAGKSWTWKRQTWTF